MLRRFRCNYRGCLIVFNVLKAAWLRHFPCCAYIDGAVDPVGPVDPVLPGVIIGGAVILGAYETGTGIYRMMNMQGLPLPSDRIELAELVWERAGKPEPQNMTDENLYADIDAADTDAQKAAHWMVEQELMKFDEDNNKFHPCFPVSKLRVCLTWQNAKDKGLID